MGRGDASQPLAAGVVPELKWLPVATLVVDHAYQRSIKGRASQRLIAKIAAEFKWSLFQAIVAAPGFLNGTFAVVDGQHRVEAAKRRRVPQVPALVVGAASVAEAAAAFVAANRDRVPVTALQIHAALLVAGDAEALAVQRACDGAGVRLLRTPLPKSQMKPGDTMAIGAVKLLLREQGEERARAALAVVREAYDAPGCIRANFILAAAGLLWSGAERTAIIRLLRSARQIDLQFEAASVADAENVRQSEALKRVIERRLAVPTGKPPPPAERPIPKSAGRSVLAAVEALKARGYRVRVGADPGSYDLGDMSGCTSADVVELAEKVRADGERAAIQKHMSEKGVTKCAPGYAAGITGYERATGFTAPPPPRAEEVERRARRMGAMRRKKR